MVCVHIDLFIFRDIWSITVISNWSSCNIKWLTVYSDRQYTGPCAQRNHAVLIECWDNAGMIGPWGSIQRVSGEINKSVCLG